MRRARDKGMGAAARVGVRVLMVWTRSRSGCGWSRRQATFAGVSGMLGWQITGRETALVCRLVDRAPGAIPARWTDLAERSRGEDCWCRRYRLGRGGCCRRGASRCAGAVWSARQPPAKTEAPLVGQLALVTSEETVAPAAVWETLPPERRRQVTLRLARLLARPVGGGGSAMRTSARSVSCTGGAARSSTCASQARCRWRATWSRPRASLARRQRDGEPEISRSPGRPNAACTTSGPGWSNATSAGRSSPSPPRASSPDSAGRSRPPTSPSHQHTLVAVAAAGPFAPEHP